MPVKRTRNAGNGPNKDELSREMRQRRLRLFIQQFEEEAREHMNELETQMENILATVDKVFKVELMKMPPSLQNTHIGDLISEEEISVSEVSIVMKTESSEPLKRKARKTVKSIDSTPVERSSSKTSKGGKGTKKTRTVSNSTESVGSQTGTLKRTRSCLTRRKTNDQTKQTTTKLRSVVSTGDMHCSLGGSAAHVTVTTAQGLTVSFSEETKDKINWDLLDDVAWCQIQKLKSLMEYLSQHSRSQL
ncbi:borealin-2 [Parambassis ranga]|uniref:Borealin-2 n=1 Tax=Parambassis ranga TaxID=210632 RepID=A0A6P7K7E7_9TELE|nr:borealin-2-like [Parambassis ranga]